MSQIELLARASRRIAAVRVVLLLAMILPLAACVPAVRQIDSGYALGEDAEVGLVLASLTYQGSLAQYAIRFRPLGDTSMQQLQIGASQSLVPPGMMDWDIEVPGTRGQLFAFELPAGRYELFEWFASVGPSSMRPSEEFSIPFDVLPGEITYIGNFNYRATGRFGASVTSLNVMHVDEFYRDTAIAADKFPRLDLERVAIRVPPGHYEEMVGGATNTTLLIVIM
jgi:hypothetical protein